MSSANLNLARKWRSKDFDQIVGQDLSVRMLKNSLYLDQYFPVYLFSGQRGCGKTTTARVFAAAINCEKLKDFKKHPKKTSVPCLKCASCLSMLAGKHPDFIEIDAASHTGVDNVRQIVDASQLLPLMGNKKIYLIDEAHMLSKAAFNAFLKILEEPPSSVLFILATTDPQKIIDTVKSRCFQLFFKSVVQDVLQLHLQNVCKTEAIPYEDAALALIIKETEGSVRDALNVIEQVRFARGSVTKQAVEHVLGHIDDERMLKLFDIIISKESHDLLQFLQELRFNLFSAEFVWNKLIEIVRAALWLKHGVQPDWFVQYVDPLKKTISTSSVHRLNSILKLFFGYESLFLKTTGKHSLLEMILLLICQENKSGPTNSGSSPAAQNAASPVVNPDDFCDSDDDQEGDDGQEIDEQEEDLDGASGQWKQFLSLLDGLNDPLLSSIFKNGTVLVFDKSTSTLKVEFAQQFSFFKETVDETSSTWLPLLKEVFSDSVVFDPQFTGQQKSKAVERTEKRVAAAAQQHSSFDPVQSAQKNKTGNGQKSYAAVSVRDQGYGRSSNRLSNSLPVGTKIDISNANVWQKAQMISRYFPGLITEIREVK